MAKQLHELYRELVTKVYEDDIDSQRYYLSLVEDHRKISVDYLLSRGCLFIPNNNYIRHYLGSDADSWAAGLYTGDHCNWTLFVLLPIEDLIGDVVGLVGWDAQNAFLIQSEGQQDLTTYSVSRKNVFQKERYFLTDIDLLKRTFDKRTVFVTDGVFDSVALNYRGIPAVALLGSSYSRDVLYFLRWYSQVFVCADNDRAGVTLYHSLKKALPNVRRVVQSQAKDIEERLRSDPIDGPVTKTLLEACNYIGRGDLYI